MVVAVIAMGMMQMAVDQIADVIAVRDRGVATARPMDVIRRMAAAGVGGRAGVGVRRAHGDHMLVDVIAVRVMQAAVVQVADMVVVLHGHMAATGAVDVIVMGVAGRRAVGHRHLHFSG